MRTYLDCIPCFLKMSLEMARLTNGNELMHKEILDEVSRIIPEFSLMSSPPEMARKIHHIIAKKVGDVDIYKRIKEKSNLMALELYPRLKEKVDKSQDRLLTAVEIAIAGNVIDYGAKNSLNIEEEIEKLFKEDFSYLKKTVFDYSQFKESLSRAKNVLFLADNAGEVVFDRVLIEEINSGREIIYAVRDKPVINDALIEDARFCGIHLSAKVISSGVDAPGTILKYCSKEFLDIFEHADLVISKGQGNYEALSQEQKELYFLFRAKCPVIARHAQVDWKDIVLMKK